MPKLFMCFFIYISLCTSSSFAFSEATDINIIINSVKYDFTSPPIASSGSFLVPLNEICDIFNIQDKDIIFNDQNKSVLIRNSDQELTFRIGNCLAYVNSSELVLPASPIVYKDITYVPIRTISEFFNSIVLWDNPSRSIFVRNLTEYKQIEKFFSKVSTNLSNLDALKIDIINNIEDGSNSYSFGNSLYIDRISKKLFYKNISSDKWAYESINFDSLDSNYSGVFDSLLFSGTSFNKQLSDENFIVFTGFYPLPGGILCAATIYINTTTLLIDKQLTKFTSDYGTISQQILYTSQFD